LWTVSPELDLSTPWDRRPALRQRVLG